MLKSISEWLFKFTSAHFSEGELIFQAGNALYPFVILAVVLMIAFGAIYAVTNIYATSRSKAVSVSLKMLSLFVLCLPLLEPALLIPDIIPNENFLAVIIDDSSSMTIQDGSFGNSRRDDVQHILLDENEGIIPELEENFKVRYYSFSDDVTRIDSIAYLTNEGTETNIAQALRRVISDFKGLPLTSVLFFTDGGDNSEDDPQSLVEQLRSLDIPLHIVGVGKRQFERERELLEVSNNKGLREGAEAEIWVKVRSWDEEKEPVQISLYKGEERVHTELKSLQGNGKTDNFTFFFDPEDDDVVEYTLHIDEASGEVNSDNNSMNILIDTRKDSVRVLFFEGHLRSDFKFIKRALENDQVFEFTSLTRTGGDKYYRQGIKHGDELKGGFPKQQEDLFRFKAIIFGDIEAAYFTIDQLEMIERFVGERGGGFLMLGAKNSFAEGDYWNTPIDDILPVVLDPGRRQIIRPDFYNPGGDSEERGIQFRPTRAGYEHPILRLTNDIGNNRAMWNEMNRLTHLSLFGGVKPGASVLAEKPADGYGPAEPLLVIQKYGKGQTAALATASTWRWQLQRDSQDMRHERFWRQLVRWLVSSTPDRVNISLEDNLYSPGDEITVRVSVFDHDFHPVDFAGIEGTVTGPFGRVVPVNFHPEINESGEYIATYIPRDQGVYTINVEAMKDGKFLGKHAHSFLSRASKQEFFNATLKQKFLENLVEANNGVYYNLSDFAAIPENLITRKTNTSVFRTEYLWDMPFLFLVALVLLSLEWIYRRRKGLP